MNFQVLKTMTIEIPLMQIAILAGLCVLFTLLSRIKLAVLSVFGYLLYWVFFLNESKFSYTQGGDVLHTGLFIIVSIIFVGCGAWIIFMER